jgi:hypothetical protein
MLHNQPSVTIGSSGVAGWRIWKRRFGGRKRQWQRLLTTHPNLARMLNSLGSKLEMRFERSGRLEDLEEAIRRVEQAVAAIPDDHPDLAGRLDNLYIELSDSLRGTSHYQVMATVKYPLFSKIGPSEGVKEQIIRAFWPKNTARSRRIRVVFQELSICAGGVTVSGSVH